MMVCYQFCVKLNKSATETFDSLNKAYGDVYQELWSLNGTKLSIKAEEMRTKHVILEGQFHQQMIKMCR